MQLFDELKVVFIATITGVTIGRKMNYSLLTGNTAQR